MNKKTSKMILVTIFILAGIYLVKTASHIDFLQAYSDGLQRNDRKGLPLEMIITADELRDMQLKHKDFLLFDARSKKSYENTHIQGALFLNPDVALKENIKNFSKNTPVITYCSSGGCQASAVLALQLKQLGFKDVKAMEDGIQTWDKKGYPVIRKKT